MQEIMTRDLFLGAAISGGLLLIAPWVFHIFCPPSHEDGLPTTVRELIARYVWGTSSLLIGMSIWLWGIDHTRLIAGMLFITVIGGAMVVFRYLSEAWVRTRNQNKMKIEIDKELK